MAISYKSSARCHFPDDSLLAESSDGVVGYTRSSWNQELDGPAVYGVFAFVAPELRASGLTEALVGWVEERNTERFRDSAAEGGVFDAWVGGDADEFFNVLVARGYKLHTDNSEMVRPHFDNIGPVLLPEGVEIRPVEESQFRTIWDASFKAFEQHEGSAVETPDMYERFLASPRRCEHLWQVAWHGDDVVGQVRTFVDEDENKEYGRLRGYTEDISTASEWRKQGIATALINSSLLDLKSRGFGDAALAVHLDGKDRALDLYKGLGYELTMNWKSYRKDIA